MSLIVTTFDKRLARKITTTTERLNIELLRAIRYRPVPLRAYGAFARFRAMEGSRNRTGSAQRPKTGGPGLLKPSNQSLMLPESVMNLIEDFAHLHVYLTVASTAEILPSAVVFACVKARVRCQCHPEDGRTLPIISNRGHQHFANIAVRSLNQRNTAKMPQAWIQRL